MKDISDGQVDTGLAVFMNTILINICTTLALSIIQRFVSLKANYLDIQEFKIKDRFLVPLSKKLKIDFVINKGLV